MLEFLTLQTKAGPLGVVGRVYADEEAAGPAGGQRLLSRPAAPP